ncbi:hypothetical protein Tco_1459429 [Tanacetum coccineum]
MGSGGGQDVVKILYDRCGHGLHGGTDHFPSSRETAQIHSGILSSSSSAMDEYTGNEPNKGLVMKSPVSLEGRKSMEETGVNFILAARHTKIDADIEKSTSWNMSDAICTPSLATQNLSQDLYLRLGRRSVGESLLHDQNLNVVCQIDIRDRLRCCNSVAIESVGEMRVYYVKSMSLLLTSHKISQTWRWNEVVGHQKGVSIQLFEEEENTWSLGVVINASLVITWAGISHVLRQSCRNRRYNGRALSLNCIYTQTQPFTVESVAQRETWRTEESHLRALSMVTLKFKDFRDCCSVQRYKMRYPESLM